jgi:serum/glucocorticoid-regulated kinase 2
VFLALDTRVPDCKKYYALKCFNKKSLSCKNQIKYTVTELNILKQLSHPYIVNLHFAFQTPNYLYLGLDYCPGRNLSHYLTRDTTFPEK